MDGARINRAISRLASEIVERNHGVVDLVLVGIERRGVPLAERLADRICELEGSRPASATLGVAFYGDDLSRLACEPVVADGQNLGVFDGLTVVLVDDVLYTGRTIHAAIGYLLEHGSPRRVLLAVLIDRGHRELPVQAEFVGKIVPTKSEEIVKVMLLDVDGVEKVVIVEPMAEAGTEH